MNRVSGGTSMSAPEGSHSAPIYPRGAIAASFWRALGFLTLLPTPAGVRFEGDWLKQTAGWFPLVGAFIGCLGACVLVAASHIWSGALPALLAVAATVAVTGALHEDGLADTADGLLGGRNRAQRLAILKDSRIGVYGASALGLALALRVVALQQLPPLMGAAALVAAHGFARATFIALMARLPYAGDPDAARVDYPDQSFAWSQWAAAAIFGLGAVLGLAVASPHSAALGVVLAALLGAVAPLAAKRRIGGYTGDILGATEQMAEVGMLLGAAAWA